MMIKLLFKTMGLFLFVVGGGSFLMWVSARFDTERHDLSGTPLISSAYAKIHSEPAAKSSNPVAAKKTPQLSIDKKLLVNYEAEKIALPISLRQKLTQELRAYPFLPSTRIRISAGLDSVAAVNAAPQSVYLRAQNTARLIFPYTQGIDIQLKKELAADSILIEFVNISPAGT